MELTISYETSMDVAHQLKEAKWLELIGLAQEAGYEVELIRIGAGSRGLIRIPGFNMIEEMLGISREEMDTVLVLPQII